MTGASRSLIRGTFGKRGRVIRVRARAPPFLRFVEPSICVRGGNAEGGIASTTQCRGRISRGYTSSPRPRPRAVPPTRKNGTSEPSRGRQHVDLLVGHTQLPESSQPQQRRGGIAAAATQARLHRNLLLERHHRVARFAAAAGCFPQQLRGLPHEIRAVGRHAGHVAANLERSTPRANVTRSNRLMACRTVLTS